MCASQAREILDFHGLALRAGNFRFWIEGTALLTLFPQSKIGNLKSKIIF
jgi:hypothetical protein